MNLQSLLAAIKDYWQNICCVTLVVLLSFFCIGTSPAWAGIDDDRYDGNIFALYAGNGSLVPPRVSLAESLKGEKPAILFFYVDDSSDCKQFSIVISQLQAYYGRAASFIPVDVDAIPIKAEYSPTEYGYYYKGLVPQTVVIDGQGQVAFNQVGQVAFEKVDDSLREVFDLLPRTESVELKRRSFNEFNTELSE
jgi:hypothetical protein